VLVGQVLRGELPFILFSIASRSSGHERARDNEVVVEAVFERGADAALGAREEARDRGGQQMRRAVAIDVQRVGPRSVRSDARRA
jgi:hypothetical protein